MPGTAHHTINFFELTRHLSTILSDTRFNIRNGESFFGCCHRRMVLRNIRESIFTISSSHTLPINSSHYTSLSLSIRIA